MSGFMFTVPEEIVKAIRLQMSKETLEDKIKANRPFTAIAEEVRDTIISTTSHISAMMDMLDKGSDKDDLDAAIYACDRIIRKFEKIRNTINKGESLLS